MGYTLQAIVGNADVLTPVTGNMPVVVLPQGKVLIPLTTDVRAKAGEIPFLPFTDDGHSVVPEALAVLCEKLSANGRIVYLEAEFFGGTGTQAMLVAEHGKVVEGPQVHADAINVALRSVGVVITGTALDEFETLRLNSHRDTDRWVP